MFKLFKAQKFQRLHCERLDLFFVLKSFGLIGIKGTMDVNNLLGVVAHPLRQGMENHGTRERPLDCNSQVGRPDCRLCATTTPFSLLIYYLLAFILFYFRKQS